MKIVVLTGSPHRKGTSALLADNFIAGAEAAGHQVYRFDAAFKQIHACTACGTCKRTDTGCVFKDDEQELYPHVLAADAIVFISPVYFYSMSAQIKLAIDRLYAIDDALHGAKQCALLVTCEDDTLGATDGAVAIIKGMAAFFGWKLHGIITALACGNRAAIEKTSYPQDVFTLGKNF
ncbi:MAG: flavodoxin family protein [Megasphaera sp.]|jgi:multimeric flavodoxin WrbA|nr:flavodoxin family protein [Megasphaera sp.]MCH4188168.1 flavodoxin family protein [Megasphaera sp.]MCH4217930.1 flavodoxin family protein [Megasphaera sp.]